MVYYCLIGKVLLELKFRGKKGYFIFLVGVIIFPPHYLVKFDFVTLDSGRLNLTVSLGGQTVSALGGALGTGFVSQTIYLFKYLTPSNNEISFCDVTSAF